MDLQRIYIEAQRAGEQFAYVEVHPNGVGGVFVKVALQTSAGRTYIATIDLNNYPSRMPQVTVIRPGLHSNSPHRYSDGKICYLHPNMWNPGLHHLTFVLARIAKWLNKYDVWCATGGWPGAQIQH